MLIMMKFVTLNSDCDKNDLTRMQVFVSMTTDGRHVGKQRLGHDSAADCSILPKLCETTTIIVESIVGRM